jgi:hypothetical protein
LHLLPSRFRLAEFVAKAKSNHRLVLKKVPPPLLIKVVDGLKTCHPQMSDAALEDLAENFRRIDADGSGELSIDEVWTLMEGQGVAIAEVWDCFAEYDVDNSGSIGFEEYLRVAPPSPPAPLCPSH